MSTLPSTHGLVAMSVVGVLILLLPDRTEACKPLDLRGKVKSIIESEIGVDSQTGRLSRPRLADRVDVSRNGGTVEMTIYAPGSGEPVITSVAYYQNGRPVRGTESRRGKTVTSMTCSYDPEGRLIERFSVDTSVPRAMR